MSAASGAEGDEDLMSGDRQYPREFPFSRDPYPVEDLSAEQQEMLGRLGAGAHAAGNASVALNPSDPAFFMLLDGHTSTPVVHRDGCYICEDPEFAQMGMPLCSACPACLRAGRGMGHIAADDTTCDECEEEHGPDDYDEEGLITGLPRKQAVAVWNAAHPRSPKED